jgi:lysophospholipase L1-like esterase
MSRTRFCDPLAVLLAMACCATARAAPPTTGPATRPIRVACVGDSITFGMSIKDPAHDGYPAQLQRLLGDGYAVANFGYNGATLLSHGDKPYVKQKPYAAALADRADVVVIVLGTNDSKPQNWAHASEFAADYAALIRAFRDANPAVQVYVGEPPPAFPGKWGINETVIAREVCPDVKRVAASNGATVIDLQAPLLDDAADFRDTVHPNAAVAGKLAKAVFEAIKPR